MKLWTNKDLISLNRLWNCSITISQKWYVQNITKLHTSYSVMLVDKKLHDLQLKVMHLFTASCMDRVLLGLWLYNSTLLLLVQSYATVAVD